MYICCMMVNKWSNLIFPRQAELLDAAAGVFIRFRLGGVRAERRNVAYLSSSCRCNSEHLNFNFAFRWLFRPAFTTRSSPIGPSLTCVPAAQGITPDKAWRSLQPCSLQETCLLGRRIDQDGTGVRRTTAGGSFAARWRSLLPKSLMPLY